jgi:hypothetical protein
MELDLGYWELDDVKGHQEYRNWRLNQGIHPPQFVGVDWHLTGSYQYGLDERYHVDWDLDELVALEVDACGSSLDIGS